MSYEPLHHKYRPQTFSQLVGQDAIATTLSHAIGRHRISPAYLFTGPRGTGKTSSARILAKSLNCLSASEPTDQPCGICQVCQGITNGSTLDVIEMDAASNTGVDNIRELIERAQFAPVQCRYKVYVIDECHMLSVAAFNALLKTLEEPPERVVFVLATTDPQRVLPTIISRCQRFDFRRISLEAMIPHLQQIAETEQIQITSEALKMVAQMAQGGLRDAESLLDQLSLLSGEITVEQVWDFVGVVPEQALLKLLAAIAKPDHTAILDQTRQLLNQGREPLALLQNLAEFYRDLLIAKTAPNRSDLVQLTPPTWKQLCHLAQSWELPVILAGQKHLQESEVQIKNTTQPRLWLEITILGLLPSALQSTPKETVPTQPQPVQRPSSLPLTPAQPQQDPPIQAVPASPQKSTDSPVTPASASTYPDLEQIWNQVLPQVKPFGTQVLFRQHGQLLAFESHLACVSIRSQPLLKMAQDKTSNLEAAFEQVYARAIKVQLTVGNQAQPKTPEHPQDFPQEQRNQTERADNLPTPSAPTVEPPTLPEPLPTPSQAMPELPSHQTEAVAIAAQTLADFFQGEILDVPAPSDTAQDPISPVSPSQMSEQVEVEPPTDDFDIPF